MESTEYFDKYLFEADPALLSEICVHLERLLPDDVDALAGLELGGVSIAAVLSQATSVKLLQIRKEPKSYGTRKQIEGGPVAGKRVVIVEDIVTSGGQIVESATLLRRHGAEIPAVISVVDREAGADESLVAIGLAYNPLFTIRELERFASATSD